MGVTWHKRKWGDDLVVPGIRLGGFMLLQQPAAFLPADSEATLSDWSGRCSVAVELDETRGLVDVTTGDARYRTTEGFQVGAEVSVVIAAWGPPDREQPLVGEGYFDAALAWSQRGVGVAVKDEKVLFMSVFPPE